MRAMDESVGMQNFEIFTNRNLGCFELPGQFGNENPALMVDQVEDGAAAFFVEHEICSGQVAKDQAQRASFFL